MKGTVQARLLGGFALSCGQARVDDSRNRSKKVWALLAYLLCERGRVVSQSELIDLLWNGERESVNPASALKTTLHRARTMLAELTAEGESLIRHTQGGYTWNGEIPLEVDTQRFEELCRPAGEDEEDGGLSRFLAALELYRGRFLEKLSSETWVIPRATYYHNLYIRTVGRALELLETHGRREEAEAVCRAALRQEPYQEDFYQHLMRTLLALDRQGEAAAVYEEMSKLLLSNFGVMPDQESRRLYRQALSTFNRSTVPAGVIREQLREGDPISGALVCDYDFFKLICQAEARRMGRSGDAAHIALLALTGRRGKELPQRSMTAAMDNMEEQIRTNLRRGDVVARCSPSQFVVLLPQANFENSGMVCQRIIRAFGRKYPHSPAEVEYTVCPVEPVGEIR